MATDLVTTEHQKRVIWLAVVYMAIAIILAVRLGWWQLGTHEELPLADGRANAIPAIRGSILDATGQYLVVSTVEYELGVSPRLLSDDQRELLAPKLAAILGKAESKVLETLSREDAEYVVLGKRLPALLGWEIEALESVDKLNMDAFRLDPTFIRAYPDASLAASVLGFIDLQGSSFYGVELRYDEELTGSAGAWRGISDSWGEQILVSLGGYSPVQDGADLQLTIDRHVQQMAEKLLQEGVEANEAAGGVVLVLDPRTGAVLAMACYPAFSPGSYWNVSSPEQYVNTAISHIYEPGSVFKPLTLAAALEANVIRPDDIYDDRGQIIVGNVSIRNADYKSHGLTSMTELLAYSYNVGSAHVAALLGPTRFYEMMRRYGFSEVTGIDLPMEAPGLMKVPGQNLWSMSELGTNSYGHGISVTPIQVAAAFGALANDGVLMRPYVVQEVRGQDRVMVHQPVPVRQVVSAGVSDAISEMLVDAVELGMQKAIVPGYRFAGKSGTAGIPMDSGFYSKEVISSFVGYGPVPDPRFVILVRLDKPQQAYWGVDVAAPIFAQMAQYLVDYYGIPPTASGPEAN